MQSTHPTHPGNPYFAYCSSIIRSYDRVGSRFKYTGPYFIYILFRTNVKHMRWLSEDILTMSSIWSKEIPVASFRKFAKTFWCDECLAIPAPFICCCKRDSYSTSSSCNFQYIWRGMRNSFRKYAGGWTGLSWRYDEYQPQLPLRIVKLDGVRPPCSDGGEITSGRIAVNVAASWAAAWSSSSVKVIMSEEVSVMVERRWQLQTIAGGEWEL